MKILIGLYTGTFTLGVCTNPRILALCEYLNGDAFQAADDCKREFKIVRDVIDGKLPSWGPAGGDCAYLTITKDLVTIDLTFEPEKCTCTLHPRQLLRILCKYYELFTTRKPFLMEAEIISSKYFSDEYPIPPEIRALPLIKLDDSIPLPLLE